MTPDFRVPGKSNTEDGLEPWAESKTRRNRQRQRAAKRRTPKEDLGTPAFPEKQRTLRNRKGVWTRSEAATSQEGRG
ncbi:hypothetical protein NDU88_000066 [Pleurodeles waltl]|uniref:Uncharacterized protein n=1 Tax=Pleurodeles waltl TaxID=8319 RepID=A0AAV7VWC1_PLEWA|nr:hypothetical protein NDU88_000066 [Pleurodeles waltl]